MVHKGGTYGQRTGEGPSLGAAATHSVVIDDRRGGKTVEVEVPEDRFSPVYSWPESLSSNLFCSNNPFHSADRRPAQIFVTWVRQKRN